METKNINNISFHILCICVVVVSCTKPGKLKLPHVMPPDCKIVLYEKEKDSLPVAYTIDSTAITITHPTGTIWHGGTLRKKMPIPKAKIEALYQLILNNHLDKIENKPSVKNNPIKQDISISIFFNKKSIVVYSGLLQLSDEDEMRFENIRTAILALLNQKTPFSANPFPSL